MLAAELQSGFKFDAAAKAETFSKVFDGGKPMWQKLEQLVTPLLGDPENKKILSLGDGPGEPGCYLAAQFGCSTISSDFTPPMVELAKKRVATQIAEGKLKDGQVECKVIDMQDLKEIDSGSIDLVSGTHSFPFAPDQEKTLLEANRVLKNGGVLGAVVWKSFELLPLAGAMMGAVTGVAPTPPPAGAPLPPPLAWGPADVTEKLLKEAGFEQKETSEDVIEFVLEDLEIAMKYCALPIWDKISELESTGKVPDAWKKFEEAWPKVCEEKGHLGGSHTGFKIKGVYRTIVAQKP